MVERTVSVRLKAEIGQYTAKMRAAGLITDKFGRETERAAKRANTQWSLLRASVAAGAPAASAAALGVAIGGVSAAFVGLGAVALRENERVLGSLRELGDTVSTGLADDASVMEGAFVGAAERMGDAFQGLRPELRDAFTAAEPLVGKLTEGVVDFAENAMPGMVRSVERAGPVMDGFASLLGSTGQGLSDLFDVVSEHSETAGEGVEHLGSLIEGVLPGIGDILGNLTDLWAEHGDEVADAVTRVVGVLGGLSGGALPVLGDALGVTLDVLDRVLDVLEPIEGVVGPMVGTWLSLALAMKAMRGVGGIVGNTATTVAALGSSSEDARGKVSRLGQAAAGAGIAIAGMQAAGAGFNALFGDDTTANVDALSLGLVRLGREGEVTGEVARVLGDDLGGLDDAFWALTGWDVDIRRFMQGIGGGFDGVSRSVAGAEKRFGEIDEALAGLVQDGKVRDAGEAFDFLAREAGEAGMPIGDLIALLPEYSAAQEVAAEATGKVGAAAEGAKLQLEAFAEQQRLAADPVFAMRDAVEQVDAAQDAYNEAIAKYAADSPQARDAAWQLAEAVAGAEQAALDGDLSFDAFKGKLAQWVQQGLITQGQADVLAGRVAHLRGEADDYAGDYNAHLSVSGTGAASSAISSLVHQLNGVPTFIPITISTNVQTGHQGLFNDLNNLPGRASGGPVWPGQTFLVGERGPELVQFSGAGTVISAEETKRAISGVNTQLFPGTATGGVRGSLLAGTAVRSHGGGGSTTTIVNHFALSAPNYVGSKEELVRVLRKQIANLGGGSVQGYLGQRGKG